MREKNRVPGQPPFVEREQRYRATQRWLWMLAGGSLVVSLVSAAAVFASAVKPTPVIVFDSKGQPVFFDDTTTARRRIDDMRIEYFAQEFLKRFVGINSGNINEDLADSINMMTPRFQQIVLHEGSELQRRAPYQNGNLKSLFPQTAFKIAEYNPEDLDARINMIAWGRIDFVPKFGEVEGNGPKSVPRYFLSELVLSREPVSKQNIHGLLVDYARTHFFETDEDLKLHVFKRQT